MDWDLGLGESSPEGSPVGNGQLSSPTGMLAPTPPRSGGTPIDSRVPPVVDEALADDDPDDSAEPAERDEETAGDILAESANVGGLKLWTIIENLLNGPTEVAYVTDVVGPHIVEENERLFGEVQGLRDIVLELRQERDMKQKIDMEAGKEACRGTGLLGEAVSSGGGGLQRRDSFPTTRSIIAANSQQPPHLPVPARRRGVFGGTGAAKELIRAQLQQLMLSFPRSSTSRPGSSSDRVGAASFTSTGSFSRGQAIGGACSSQRGGTPNSTVSSSSAALSPLDPLGGDGVQSVLHALDNPTPRDRQVLKFAMDPSTAQGRPSSAASSHHSSAHASGRGGVGSGRSVQRSSAGSKRAGGEVSMDSRPTTASSTSSSLGRPRSRIGSMHFDPSADVKTCTPNLRYDRVAVVADELRKMFADEKTYLMEVIEALRDEFEFTVLGANSGGRSPGEVEEAGGDENDENDFEQDPDMDGFQEPSIAEMKDVTSKVMEAQRQREHEERITKLPTVVAGPRSLKMLGSVSHPADASSPSKPSGPF